MSNKELKTLWKVSSRFWISGTLFWIIETLGFIMYEGWHLKATHPIEIFCDDVVSGMWKFALWLTIYTSFCLLFNSSKTKK
jgi:hypothetical protein